MAKKSRITLSLDQEVCHVLAELSQISGLSVSAFVNQVLVQSLPQMRSVASAYQLLATDPVRSSRVLIDSSDESIAQLEEITNKIKGKLKPKEAKKTG